MPEIYNDIKFWTIPRSAVITNLKLKVQSEGKSWANVSMFTRATWAELLLSAYLHVCSTNMIFKCSHIHDRQVRQVPGCWPTCGKTAYFLSTSPPRLQTSPDNRRRPASSLASHGRRLSSDRSPDWTFFSPSPRTLNASPCTWQA